MLVIVYFSKSIIAKCFDETSVYLHDDRLLIKAKQSQNIFRIEVENPTIWLMKILQTEEENDENDGN
jgi:hypothetical protein